MKVSCELPLLSATTAKELRMVWVRSAALASHTCALYDKEGESPVREVDRLTEAAAWFVRQTTAWPALLTAATAAVRDPLL